MLRSIITTALLMATCAGAAQGQSRFGMELRGGAGLPAQDFGEATLKTGAGFDVTVNYQLMPHTRVYAGWDWYRFVTDKPFANAEFDIEDTGYAFGLHFKHPLVKFAAGWLRAGGVFDHVELENSAGDIVSDSGHELGWEAGAGLSVPIGQRLALTPGVRYRTFSAKVDAGEGSTPVDLSYVAVEVGLSWSFGGNAATTAITR